MSGGKGGSYHHGDLRNALVTAAVAQIDAGGVAAFSLREAARTVGVSANAAYRHFADRSALLRAVAVRGFEQLARAMQRARARAGEAGRDAKEDAKEIARFKATGRAYVRFALRYPHRFRLMFGPDGLCTMREGDQPSPSAYDVLGESLDELVEAGLLSPRTRPRATLAAWTVVHGFATLLLEDASRYGTARERDAALEALLEFAVAGLLARDR